MQNYPKFLKAEAYYTPFKNTIFRVILSGAQIIRIMELIITHQLNITRITIKVYKKKLVKDIKVFLKKKKKKSDKTVMSDTKIYQTMKSWLSIEKNLQNENHLANIVRNYFCSEIFFFKQALGIFLKVQWAW